MAPVLFSEEVRSTPTQISIVSLFFTFICLLWLFETTKSKRPNLPPGPWKLPVIGNMNQLMGSLPHILLRNLALRYGPLFHLQLGQISTIVASNAETAKEIMKTYDVSFASRPKILAAEYIAYGSTDVVFSPYGSYWRHVRKICVLELLSIKRVNSFNSIREEEVWEMVRTICFHGPSPINLSEKLSALTNDVTARATFSKKCNDQQGFKQVLKESLELAGGFSFSDFFPSLEFINIISGMKARLVRTHSQLDWIVGEIIEEHKHEKRKGKDDEDMVDVLLRLKEEGDVEIALTTDNIKAIILDMFSAGTETSSTIMDWAMAELMRNPRVMEKAQREVREVVGERGRVETGDIHKLHYLKLVVKETLRLHPPLPLLIPRESIEGCKVQGYEIPTKTRVIINYWSISRDPKYWKSPEVFEPERFSESSIDFRGHDFDFIPFGAGRRGCPGIAFGVANVELVLAQLLYCFDWKLPNKMKPQNVDMGEVFMVTLQRKSKLNLIPIPHFPSLFDSMPKHEGGI